MFIDTPGIHKSDNLFNKRMMATVRGALDGRDVVLFVADATKPVSEKDEQAVAVLREATNAVLVLNKIDRLDDKRLLLPLTERFMNLHSFAEVVPVSAAKGAGIDELLRTIVKYLPEGQRVFAEDYMTDQPMRFLAGEIIREKILRAAREEVPHAVAVLIERWEELPELTKISATIHVERPGQKAILIGRKGDLLKRIGTEARQEIEQMTGAKVFLSLFVKVNRNWREDPEFLNAIDWRAMVGSE